MKHLLLVDDDQILREILADLFVEEGYAVSSAASGSEALRLVREQTPDLILTDLMMPDLDGWRFLEACLGDERLARIPVVVLSAAYGLSHVAHLPNVRLCLAKPFDLGSLLAVVRRLVAEPSSDRALSGYSLVAQAAAEVAQQPSG